MAVVDDLDAKAFEVLEAVYESGGEANTSEIKEYTGIEKNAIIHYRYDRLEEAGLITTRTGEATGARVPPKVAVLTDEAQEQIAGGLFDTEDSTIVERMDRLERQFSAVVDQFRDLEQSVRRFTYDEEADDEITAAELVYQIDQFRELADDLQEREEEAVGVEELADTVDWAERVLSNHESEILELQDVVGINGHGQDYLDADDLRARLDQAEQEAEEAREDAEQARAAADDLRQEVQQLRTERSQIMNRLDDLENQQDAEQSGGFLSSLGR